MPGSDIPVTIACEKVTGSSRLERSILRILAPDGAVVGAGFLVGERRLLTCAHVVNKALGRADEAAEPPQAEILVEFPFMPEAGRVHFLRLEGLTTDQGADYAD